MKTITAHEHDLILDVTGGGLTPLPAGVLEKDVLITSVLRALSDIDSELKLVFCGGTCLSKAHGLIDRMSEDIDFKVILPEGLSRSARSRALSSFKKQLVKTLADAEFNVLSDGVIAKDENNYIGLNLHYESRFPVVASLRPEIKIEINARPPLLPTAILQLRSILDVLVNSPTQAVPFRCISVQETLAEKVLSFLRRTAEHRGERNRFEFDDRLVRHIYDVAAIMRANKEINDLPVVEFHSMIEADAIQFKNQYPEFRMDPFGEMQCALDALQQDEAFERDYQRFVDELVFGKPIPFDEAKQLFAGVAQHLLDAAGGRVS